MSADPATLLQELLADLRVATPGQSPATSEARALAKLAEAARLRGLVVLEMGAHAPGELRDAVNVLAAIALQGVRFGRAAQPTLLLWSGPLQTEGSTVDATQLLLALGRALDAHPAIHALAADGRSAPAGGAAHAALLRPDTFARARHAGCSPTPGQVSAGEFFERLGDRYVLATGVACEGLLCALLLN